MHGENEKKKRYLLIENLTNSSDFNEKYGLIYIENATTSCILDALYLERGRWAELII